MGARYWMMALAIAPLIRLLMTSASEGPLSFLRSAELSLWLSSWLVEVAVILVAVGRGLNSWTCFQRLPITLRLGVGIWATAVVISTIQATAAPVLALLGAIEWLLHAVFALAAWFLMSENSPGTERQFLSFCRVYPLVTVLVGVSVLGYVLVTGVSADRDWESILPGFAHIRHSGYLFAPAMAICGVRIAIDGENGGRAMLLLAVNTGLCLWFGSRGPFLGLAAGLAVTAFLCASLRKPGVMGRLCAALLLGALLSVSIPTPEAQGFGGVSRVAQAKPDANSLTTGRVAFWEESIELSAARPVFGHGSRQFQFTSQIAKNEYKHPHNFIFQVIFEWGLVGGAAFLYILLFAAVAIMRAAKAQAQASSYPIAVAGFATMTAMAMVDGIFYYPSTLSLTILFILVALKRVDRAAEDVRPVT